MATTPSTKGVIDTLRVGISKVESGAEKDPYRATSPDGQAYGKYQFRKSYWWDNNKNNIDSIKKFAASRKDVYGEVNTFEDFRANDALQEAYFSYYVNNHVLPTAQKAIAKGNPLNLTLDQAAAMIHFKGSGTGAKIITSGKTEGKTATNLSDLGYLDVYNKEIQSKGLKHITADAYVAAKAAAEGEKSLTPDEKKIVQTREQRKADYAKRDQAIDKMEADGVDIGTRENLRRDLLKEISRNGDQGLYDEYIKEANAKQETKTDQISKDVAAWNDRTNKPKGKRDPRLDTVKVAESTGVNSPKKHTPENKQPAPQRPSIDWASIDTEVAKEAIEADKKVKVTGTGEGIDIGLTNTEGKSTNTEAKKSGEEVTDSAGQFLERQDGILSSLGKSGMEYEKSNYKKELPVDAITGLALGLIGNKQAKDADVPLRTEDVGQAVKAYTSELALRSREGLPPEVEAAITNKLAEAYQGGLANVRNASGGNRATVLGNQGGLEVAKNRGLVDMQIADYEAKERAFQQYGEAIQYIDKVRMNRDVANTTLKQQRGLQKEAEGKQLANAGFAKMIDSIKYQKENGPGSANHMYKSALLQKMFGFDPMMKDDGTGKPGTRSAFQKQRAELELQKADNSALTEKYFNLDPEARKQINDTWLKNPTGQNLKGLVDQFSPQLGEESGQIPALATAPTQPTQETSPQPGEALGGISTALGFFPNKILGTEPSTISPNTNIPNLAAVQTPGVNATGLLPLNEAPVPESRQIEMPTFDSAIAESTKNQLDYYNNQ